MKHKSPITVILLCLVIFCPAIMFAQTGVSIIDSRHYSNVFGETRSYRIFLPPGYDKNSGKKYPVIYFLHGWSQRSFGSSISRYSEFDAGTDNNGDNMEKFVATHEVIVVKSDGYNRSIGDEYYPRPYNIGPVETFRQFPVYFPELIAHIDASYNTIPKRENRAITGLSMGGFMSFVIGGKYPHLFSAVGNFCGSPEFFIGPKEMPVEYRHLDMYNNYEGLKVRLNYGDKDFIRNYHEDLNKVWLQVMDNYEYKIYPTEHTTSGLGEMFSFLFDSFKNPSPKPSRWHHVDIYPEFSVWDYTVKTDRIVPGFTKLENVDKRGFKCSVREFLPDGELLTFVKVTIITSPVYEKQQQYLINNIELVSGKSTQQIVQSDNEGRLKIELDGGLHQVGINKKTDKANIAIAGVSIKNGWAVVGKDNELLVKFVNKGLASANGLKLLLSTKSKSVSISKNNLSIGSITVNELKESTASFVFKTLSDTIEVVKFKLEIEDNTKNKWAEFFEIPVRRDVEEIKQFEIADGKTFSVWKGGVDSETVKLGYGNGDGIANPGESIEVLIKDGNNYRRTSLYSSDNAVNPFGMNRRGSDYWGTYDNVGGSAKYSIPVLASSSTGRSINFFAEYWLPDKPNHIIKQGIVTIKVTGKDETPPLVYWAKVVGDNVLHVKLIDGVAIKSVVAAVIGEDKKGFTINLKNNGEAADSKAGDNVFSKLIAAPDFGHYKISIEAIDSFGNKSSSDLPGTFMLFRKRE